MSTDLDRIDSVEVGIPGPAGAGITVSEKTAFDSRISALEAEIGVIVQDESTPLATQSTTLNFVGGGVTATGTGAVKTITIPAASLTVQEGDVTVNTNITTLDFNDADFNLTESPTGEININRNRPSTIFADHTLDSGFPSITTSTTTVDSVEIGPGQSGITYDIECEVHMRGGPDASGFLRGYARIASDSSNAGERTGTVGGERSICATTHKLAVVGDGVTTYTLASRAAMDAGTGTISSSHIRGRMIPR